MTDYAKWLLSMGLALALGIVVGRMTEPDQTDVWIVDQPVTSATAAPATPAGVGK